MIYGLPLTREDRRPLHHYSNKSKIKSFFAHITWLYLESPRGDNSTTFKYGLPPQKTANM